MKKTVATLAALVVGPVLATPAQAATGGEVTDDPGVVALLDAQGEHRCSAVLVAKDWALAWSDSTRCAATGAVATNGRTASVDDHRYFQQRDGVIHTDPSKSQAMLVHLDHPLEGVATARLSDRAPQAGERLSVVAVNSSEDAATPTLGRADVTVDGHNRWISWFEGPEGMTLEHRDSGAALMRGDEVVGFVGLARPPAETPRTSPTSTTGSTRSSAERTRLRRPAPGEPRRTHRAARTAPHAPRRLSPVLRAPPP
ncbi:hypothetical protein, partial [Actinomyces radicidentis]